MNTPLMDSGIINSPAQCHEVSVEERKVFQIRWMHSGINYHPLDDVSGQWRGSCGGLTMGLSDGESSGLMSSIPAYKLGSTECHF